jgi:hypothetical protein
MLFEPSSLRVDKARTEALVTLATGATIPGYFFVAHSGRAAGAEGPERIADLLNADPGFFPFEVLEAGAPRTVLYNRAHVVTVAVPPDEAQRDAGYSVAPRRAVVLRLSDGRSLDGWVRVYRPRGRDRLSDWARHGDRFRYVELADGTLVVNVEHVVEAREAADR